VPDAAEVSKLRIAMVAPPWFPIPPDGYGGIENVIACLVDELVEAGHEVTLVSAGAHRTRAQHHVPVFDEPPTGQDCSAFIETWYTARAEAALPEARADIVHDHSLAGPLGARGRACPTVHTAHNPVHARFGDYLRHLGTAIAPVAISNAQVDAAPDLSWAGCVPNGIDLAEFPFQPAKSEYLLFLGRITPEKGAHLAIDIALAADRPIIVAGRCEEPTERRYFQEMIEPRLGRGVQWVGPADSAHRNELLANAAGLLCPFQWDEPFGMVIAEAAACGTPTIATPRGAAPELIEHGLTGFLAADHDAAVQAVAELHRVEPTACRMHAATSFSATRMATGYVSVYRHVLSAHREHGADGSHRD
jgi:glycosyltransferase involved in cell wall biosynthesis